MIDDIRKSMFISYLTYKYLLDMYDSILCLTFKEKINKYKHFKMIEYRLIYKGFFKIYCILTLRRNKDFYDLVVGIEEATLSLMKRKNNVDYISLFEDEFQFICAIKKESENIGGGIVC